MNDYVDIDIHSTVHFNPHNVQNPNSKNPQGETDHPDISPLSVKKKLRTYFVIFLYHKSKHFTFFCDNFLSFLKP